MSSVQNLQQLEAGAGDIQPQASSVSWRNCGKKTSWVSWSSCNK